MGIAAIFSGAPHKKLATLAAKFDAKALAQDKKADEANAAADNYRAQAAKIRQMSVVLKEIPDLSKLLEDNDL